MSQKISFLRSFWLPRTVIFLLIAGALVIGGTQLAAATSSGSVDSESAVAVGDTTFTQFDLVMQLTQTGVTDADQACIICHTDTDAVIELESGETIAALVDTAVLNNSAHGTHADTALGCTDCHSVIDYQYPHQPVTSPDLATYQLEKSTLCTQCHVEPHLTSHPALDSDTPVGCTSCHGGHNVLTKDQWQSTDAVNTCVNCHTSQNIELADADQLQSIISAGLFTERYETNTYCLACHSQEGLTLTFPNGDTKSATINPGDFHASVHGDTQEYGALQCVQCHEAYAYPHEPVTAESAREYSLVKYPVCATCHETKYESAVDDVHGKALAEGNLDAAVCTDCHGAHDTAVPDEPRQRISETCRQCHSTIYDEYASSVHGEALIGESNPDVPTCIECHGVHNITDPTTALFRVRSPELCATCHANDELMTKYDISTEVFDTYVADFHGTTVTLFEHQDPNAETNKAVCYDCHGVHNIKAPDDPESGIKANLLATCQQCHPDANENFPDSWTSHFQPSLQHNPLVYLVNLFYQIVIPVTVGLFGFIVATDVYRRVRTRLRL